MITWRRIFHVDLAYHVLSHLDLAGDAANLYVARETHPSWVAPLLQHYRAAGPRALALHAWPLLTEDLDSLVDKLTLPARLLEDHFAAALLLEAGACRERRQDDLPLTRACVELTPLLERARAELYSGAPGAPPPLEIIDAPALGPNGRGAFAGHIRRVAVSTAGPLPDLLCQIVHEEAHAVSDPPDTRDRDTRPWTLGHTIHSDLESRALDLGERIFTRALPEHAAAYTRWRRRFSC